jgi:hypothetical protein
MGLLRDAVKDCPLAYPYKRSRKGLWNEQTLAYCAKKKGRDTYRALGPRAPSVWHLVHADSLTRGGFWHEFWIHYDRVANYWRLKNLGAQVSPYAYLAACLVTLKRGQLPRLLATSSSCNTSAISKTADPQSVGGIAVASSGAGGDTAIDPLGAAPQIDDGPLTGLGLFAGFSTLATSFFTSCAATSSLGHGLNTPSGSGPLYR